MLTHRGLAQTTFTSNGDGDWDNPATWNETGLDDPDDIPDANDIVIISASHTVSMTTAGTFDADDLTISGTLHFPSNNRTLNVGGNLVMSGTSAITGNNNNRILNVTGTFTVSSGATATINGQRITITGNTTLDGTLVFASATGDKTFGTVDVNATGHWNNNSAEDFVFNGNLINDGTWTGCSNQGCLYEFTSSSGTISGSTTTSIPDILINSPASITNNGTLLLTDDFTGTGTFTNGVTGDFQISGNNNLTLSTFDFTTSGNTVTYTGGSNTTILTETFHNLVVAKSAGNRAQVGSTITVNNDVTVSSGEFRIIASGTANISGDMLVTGGEFSPNDATGVVNVTGDLNMSSGTYDQNNGDVNVTGDLIISGGTMTMNGTGSTVDVDDFTLSTGTVTLTQGALNVNNALGGLTVNSGSLTIANAALTMTVAGTYQVSGGTNDLNNGTLNTVNLTIDNGDVVLLGGTTLAATGTTTVNGTLTIDGTGGTKTFDDLTVSATGNWNVTAAESFTINGNVVSNGTWTGCSNTACVYTLTSTTGTLSGSTQMSVGTMTINSPASYTSTGSVLINNDFLGDGSFTNGNGSTLELSGAGPFSITTLNASTNSNTVTYSGGSNVTVNGATYHNLTVNKTSNTATISSATTVNNNLTVSGGIVAVGATTLNITNDLLINGGEFSPGDASSVVNVGGNMSMTSGLYDQNLGDVNVTGSLTVSNGVLTMDNAGSTFDVGGNYLISGGTNDFNAGAFSAGSLSLNSGQIMTVGGLDFTINGASAIDGTLTVDNANGTKAFGDVTVSATGHWNVAAAESFTINGNIASYGTWTGCSNTTACTYNLTSSTGTITGTTDVNFADVNIDAPGSYTNSQDVIISDDLTGTGSFTNAAGSTLEFSGDGPLSITTFNASANANTVTFSGGSNISVNPGDYYNLVFNKSGNTATIGGTTNVLNDLSLNNLGALAIGAATLSVTNDVTISGPELTPNDASAVMNVGGNLSMSGGLYDHNDGDVNITGDFIVTGGTMTLNQGTTSTIDADDFSIATGSVTLNSGTMNVTNATGGLTVSSGSLVLAGATLAVTNFYDLNGGTNDFNSGTFSAASLDIASSQLLTVGNLTFTISGASEINGTLTFDNNSGSKSLGDVNVNSGGAWDNNTAADFTITGSIVSNGASWTGCSANGCDYTLTSSSGTISGSTAVDMSDIIINGPASYTSTANLSVIDRITGTGTFVNGANASLTYSGNNSSGANFDITSFTASATGNTVTYGRAGDQQLRTTTDGDNNYYNLVINSTAAGNDLNLAGDITIDNQLTLTLGDAILGTNRLTLADGATISGGSADSYIAINSTGVLRQNYSAAGATLAFPIGDAGDYSPITAFTINSATFGAGAYLEFGITDAAQPNRDTANTPTGDDDGTAAVDYISRYWTVTDNNIDNPDYNTDFVYVDADIVGTESNMVGTLYRTHPSLGILDWFVTGTVNPSNNTVSLTNADAFGDLYAMDNTLSRLPIVLVSFEAREESGRIVLSWVTASEESNAFFTIERSVNGIDFEEVLMRDGAGNSQTLLHYEATDVNPPAGRVFYRLRQTDFNGTFEYSDLVSVDVRVPQQEPLTFVLHGNLVRPGAELVLNRSHAGEARVFLRSVDGRRSITYEIDSQAEAEFNLQLPLSVMKGMYVLQLVQNGQKLSKKLVVQ